MKKTFKKLAALFGAAAMVMGLTLSANAAKITLNSTATEGNYVANATEYTYYEVLKADLTGLTASDFESNGQPKASAKVVYYVEDKTLADALTATGKFTVNKVDGQNRWNVQVNNEVTAEQLVTALNVDTIKNAAIATGTFSQDMKEKKAVSPDLDPGYYLILSSNGTNVALQTLADVTIDEKNNYPDVDKKITGEREDTYNPTTENQVNIGDIVTYTVPVTIPGNVAEKEMVVTDTMFEGLTLQRDSLSADKTWDGISFDTNSTTTTIDGKNYNVYTITIPAATVFANKGSVITLTYKAILNDKAVINGDNPNTVKLDYDNYTTTDHTVITKTFKCEVNKVAEDGTTKLDGAVFTLQNKDGKYYVNKSGDHSVWQSDENTFTTAKTGNLVFEGLDAGSYTLTEKEAPKGYNVLTAPIIVTISETGEVTYSSEDNFNTASNVPASEGVIVVKNQSGSTLPSTGGMGTTIFYVIGGILILAAAIILISRRRVQQ